MSQPDNCDLCGECLTQCQWMSVEPDQAREWMTLMRQGKPSPALDLCVTCFACHEICPRQARPFDLIAELQEKFGSVMKKEDVAAMEARYVFSGRPEGYPRGHKTIMSLCVFGKSEAPLVQGELYDLPKVTGKPYFCWVLFNHMGGPDVQRRHARETIDRLAATGAEEVVCFHDDCYTLLTHFAPEYGLAVPFRPVHLAEYLVRYLRDRSERIRPLNLDMAYQRPCASRFTPEKEHFIDELFDLVGVRRVQRTHDRERALCCAGAKLLLGRGDPRPDQEKNINDARKAGAEALVCLCPVCIHSLSAVAGEQGLPLIFLGDLARMALGELPVPA